MLLRWYDYPVFLVLQDRRSRANGFGHMANMGVNINAGSLIDHAMIEMRVRFVQSLYVWDLGFPVALPEIDGGNHIVTSFIFICK